MFNFFIKNALPKKLPNELEGIIEGLKGTKSQEACLKKAYEIITKKYSAGRVETYLNLLSLFSFDVFKIWKKSGFLHCTHQNHILRLLLIGSGKFGEEDIRFVWTTIWIFSPHQYAKVELENGEKINVDCWAKTYGIAYGNYARGFNQSSFPVKSESAMYDNFSSTFAQSRKNMRWPEIEYFIEDLKKRPIPNFSSSSGTCFRISNRGVDAEINSAGHVLRILDVGCGSGRLYGELKNAKIEAEYLGIDNSSGMIQEARKAYPEAKFDVLDMQNLDTLDMKFDAVFFLASFHHLESEGARFEVLQKLRGVLAPGGTAYMTNWNLLSDENMRRYESMYRGNGDFDIKIGAHTRYYHGFTTTELAELFKKTDFHIEENRVFDGGRNLVTTLKV